VAFGEDLIIGGDCRSSYLAGNTSAYKWAKKYHVATVGQESKVLVLHPSMNQGANKEGVVNVLVMRLDKLKQPTFVARLLLTSERSTKKITVGVIPFSPVQGIGMVTSLKRCARCSWTSFRTVSRFLAIGSRWPG
jgi:hypothetical protein